MPGLDDISRAIGELQGTLAELSRLYIRVDARLEQMSRDLTREIAETRDSWHRRANEWQTLLGKIEMELLQGKEDRHRLDADRLRLETEIEKIKESRRRSKGEIRLSSATIGAFVAALIQGLVLLWKWMHGGD